MENQSHNQIVSFIWGNVQEILERFKFRNQVDTMSDTAILGAVIEKFVNPAINLSPNPVLDDLGNARRYVIERDLVEAIIALPENSFYNTGIGTFILLSEIIGESE